MATIMYLSGCLTLHIQIFYVLTFVNMYRLISVQLIGNSADLNLPAPLASIQIHTWRVWIVCWVFWSRHVLSNPTRCLNVAQLNGNLIILHWDLLKSQLFIKRCFIFIRYYWIFYIIYIIFLIFWFNITRKSYIWAKLFSFFFWVYIKKNCT